MGKTREVRPSLADEVTSAAPPEEMLPYLRQLMPTGRATTYQSRSLNSPLPHTLESVPSTEPRVAGTALPETPSPDLSAWRHFVVEVTDSLTVIATMKRRMEEGKATGDFSRLVHDVLCESQRLPDAFAPFQFWVRKAWKATILEYAGEVVESYSDGFLARLETLAARLRSRRLLLVSGVGKSRVEVDGISAWLDALLAGNWPKGSWFEATFCDGSSIKISRENGYKWLNRAKPFTTEDERLVVESESIMDRWDSLSESVGDVLDGFDPDDLGKRIRREVEIAKDLCAVALKDRSLGGDPGRNGSTSANASETTVPGDPQSPVTSGMWVFPKASAAGKLGGFFYTAPSDFDPTRNLAAFSALIRHAADFCAYLERLRPYFDDQWVDTHLRNVYIPYCIAWDSAIWPHKSRLDEFLFDAPQGFAGRTWPSFHHAAVESVLQRLSPAVRHQCEIGRDGADWKAEVIAEWRQSPVIPFVDLPELLKWESGRHGETEAMRIANAQLLTKQFRLAETQLNPEGFREPLNLGRSGISPGGTRPNHVAVNAHPMTNDATETAPAGDEVTIPDGPVGTNGFRWKGKIHRMQPLQAVPYAVLCKAYRHPLKTLSTADIDRARLDCGTRDAKNPTSWDNVETIRTRINAWLMGERLPMSVKLNSARKTLELQIKEE